MKKVLAILTLLVFITGCGCENEEKIVLENAKANLNENIIAERTIDGVLISNVSVIYDNALTTFRAEFKAVNDITLGNVKIVFKAKSGMVLATLKGYVNKELKTNESTIVVITSDIDLSDAVTIEYSFE